MRIGIDARYLSHGLMGGVHTYCRSLIPALLAAGPGEEFFLYADAKRPFELEPLPANATLRVLPYRSAASSLANDLVVLRRAMRADALDLAHFPANAGIAPPGSRSVVTLHDEINLLPWLQIVRGHRKNPRTIAMMSYLHLWSTASVRRADRLLTVSQHARQRIAEAGGIDPQRIVAVHSAPAPGLRRVTDEETLRDVRMRFALRGPFVLADALKNPAALLRAWARLEPTLRAGTELVFFCRTPAPPPALQNAIATGRARVLFRPAHADLMALYSMAAAFVFPSWIEGFGLPVLEAMLCGAPVICSDRGSLPEVAGQAALIVDAEDDAAIAAHLNLLLTDHAAAATWQARGFAHAAHFGWDRTARAVLDLYHSLVAAPGERSVRAPLPATESLPTP